MYQPLSSARGNHSYQHSGNEVLVVDLTPKPQPTAAGRVDAVIVLCYIVVAAASAYLGHSIAREYGVITDEVMQGYQTTTVNGMCALLLFGIAAGAIAFFVTDLGTEELVCCTLVSIAFLGIGIAFLWTALLQPHLPQLMEQIRLIIEIRSGSTI